MAFAMRCSFIVDQMFSLQEMEEFAQSSGKNGIVVFTLGSAVKNISEERANVIASALAQIPQKVRLSTVIVNNSVKGLIK